jgi:hypothetical protein
LVVAALAALIGPLGYWAYGWPGVWAVLSAAALCGSTGIAAFWVGRHFLAHGHAIGGVLGAMAIRMGIPLVICLALAVRGNADSMAGFVYYLLAFYLGTLAVETWYSLPSAGAVRPVPARE